MPSRLGRSVRARAVRHRGEVALGGDGQVTMGQTVVKSDAVKIRKLLDDKVLGGCAGAAGGQFSSDRKSAAVPARTRYSKLSAWGSSRGRLDPSCQPPDRPFPWAG